MRVFFKLLYVEDHVICKHGEFYIFFSNMDSFYLLFFSDCHGWYFQNNESKHTYLIPDSRGNTFNFLPLRIKFAVGLSYMAFFFFFFLMLRYLSAFWRDFLNHKWVLNFLKIFLCIYGDNHMVFIFQFVNMRSKVRETQVTQ